MGPRKDRVLVLTTSFPRYDDDHAGHFVSTEVDQLVEQGHQVTVLCAGARTNPPSTHGPKKPEQDCSNPQIHFLGGAELFDHPGALPRVKEKPWRLFWILIPSLQLLRRALLVSSRSYDQVIAHFLLPSAFPWALFFGSVSNGLEVVIHGSDLVLFQALPRMAQALILRRILRLKGRLRFVSEEQKRQLLAKSWPEPIREMIVRAAVRPSPIFVSTPPPRDEARLQLGLGPSCRIALWVGRLISSKRPEAAISAAELVPGLELYVIGDGPLRGTLQERHPWAHFLGRRSRKETLLWMRAADLLLATSQLEGAPTAIREARMLGTTVVSVACGDVAAWAKNDPELWITSPLNASSMDV